jgi:hypothetical protein
VNICENHWLIFLVSANILSRMCTGIESKIKDGDVEYNNKWRLLRHFTSRNDLKIVLSSTRGLNTWIIPK